MPGAGKEKCQMRRKRRRYERKKQRRLPVHVYLSYFLVAALLFTGVTFSRYVAATKAGDSARAATFGDLVMTEKEKPGTFVITPGVNIKKNPLVSFGVEKKSESAAYVFVYVNALNWEFDSEGKDTYKIKKDEKALMSWSVDSRWKYADGGDSYQVFYFYVSPNETMQDVQFIENGEITVSPQLYASEYQALASVSKSITFKACAVQANGFEDPQQAWQELAKSIDDH